MPDGMYGKKYCSETCGVRAGGNYANHEETSRSVKGGPVPIDITLDELNAVRVRSLTCECPKCVASDNPRGLVFDGDERRHANTANIDHIVGRGWGVLGPHIPENCRPAAGICNQTRPRDCSDVTSAEARVVLDALVRRAAARPEVATPEQIDLMRSFVEWREHCEQAHVAPGVQDCSEAGGAR